MDKSILQGGAKITLAYFAVFFILIFFQAYAKVTAMLEHKKKKANAETKEKFNRYVYENNPLLLAADRSVGNFSEWMGPFLTLFWLNAAMNGTHLEYGWVYIGARILYPILACLGGIKPSGPQPLIFLSTIPGYNVLFFYAYQIFKAL